MQKTSSLCFGTLSIASRLKLGIAIFASQRAGSRTCAQPVVALVATNSYVSGVSGAGMGKTDQGMRSTLAPFFVPTVDDDQMMDRCPALQGICTVRKKPLTTRHIGSTAGALHASLLGHICHVTVKKYAR
jgi:hypothetical protein